MNWEAIGAVGEIVGAIAVIVTLGYLAVQIRQNTRTVRASTHHGISRELNELNIAFGSDPAVSSLLLRGSEDYSQLDHDERFQYTLLMRAAFGTYNDAFLQFREHLISGSPRVVGAQPSDLPRGFPGRDLPHPRRQRPIEPSVVKAQVPHALRVVCIV